MTQLSIFDLQKNDAPAPARSQVRSKDLFDCCSRYRVMRDVKKLNIYDLQKLDNQLDEIFAETDYTYE